MDKAVLNVYEKQSLYEEAIEKLELKLGQYLSYSTTSRDDPYAKQILERIFWYRERLEDLLTLPLKDNEED